MRAISVDDARGLLQIRLRCTLGFPNQIGLVGGAV
jgi:hypothetical protein